MAVHSNATRYFLNILSTQRYLIVVENNFSIFPLFFFFFFFFFFTLYKHRVLQKERETIVHVPAIFFSLEIANYATSISHALYTF